MFCCLLVLLFVGFVVCWFCFVGFVGFTLQTPASQTRKESNSM